MTEGIEGSHLETDHQRLSGAAMMCCARWTAC
jgi:hypothetical protein